MRRVSRFLPRSGLLLAVIIALCVLSSSRCAASDLPPAAAALAEEGHLPPSHADSAPFLDELSQPKPWWHINTFARGVRRNFRAFVHSLRDLFFPDFRLQSAAINVSASSIDKLQPGENPDDYAARLAARDWLIGKADALGLPSLYAQYPTAFRYSTAIILGLVLMVFFFSFQQAVNLLVKACMRVLLRATGDALFVDETSDSEIALLERLQEEAERRRAQAEAGQAKKQDKEHEAPQAQAAAASSSTAASKPSGSSGVRRRKEA